MSTPPTASSDVADGPSPSRELSFTPAAGRGALPYATPCSPSGSPDAAAHHLAKLNEAQRRAVRFGLPGRNDDHAGTGHAPRPASPPLLIIAGAGTGKTTTLAHRVAECVLRGVDPARILLLTFTRRAAREMTRRAERIAALAARSQHARRGSGASGRTSLRWAGTFHAVANRLLRLYAPAIGLEPSFTVLDRADAEDLLDVVRHQAGLARHKKRFPRKGTCLAIYSRCVNSGEVLQRVLDDAFPWCADWHDELRALFRDYVSAKQARAVLDYDDLLLCWFHLMQEPALARQVAARFDHVLVDEYQDTNALQAQILRALRPDGAGLTVVGDDAQAIYAFRAATVRNILDFPRQFEPAARVITLEQNYRSVQPILDAANAVIGLAAERYAKDLFCERPSQQKPRLVAVEDESEQADYIVDRVLAAREAGSALQDQAVLFRTVHHADLLQIELSRRDIPFVVYGGLRFLEAAHVKDLLCVLRWAENPRDGVAAFRTLQLFPGIGPAGAQRILDVVTSMQPRRIADASAARAHRSYDCDTTPQNDDARDAGLPAHTPDERGADAHSARLPLPFASIEPPAAAREDWPAFVQLMGSLTAEDADWPGQVGEAVRWYEPHLERLYDAPGVRRGDLEQLELVAGQYPDRARFLAEVTIDPPSATGDLAGPPHLDEDYLVLSTIHSAKGQEWDHVYVMNLVDGCIPSDMATGSAEEIEEERRLLYVAMTRARDELHLIHPLRFYAYRQQRHGDRHVYAPLSRFLPAAIAARFETTRHGRAVAADDVIGDGPGPRIDLGARLREMW